MRSLVIVAGFLSCAFAASLLAAQELPGLPQPQAEHEWLRQFVGEWETEGQALAAPGEPAMTCKGTMRSRMLGGFWVVSESQTEMTGASVKAIQTIGYDPEKKKYVGTWVDSMINHLWKYEGEVDETGKKLTLEAAGPNFLAAGKTAKFRDAYEFKSPDHIITTSQMQGDDGQWVTFMTGHARRKK
jgi:hypothetical protein